MSDLMKNKLHHFRSIHESKMIENVIGVKNTEVSPMGNAYQVTNKIRTDREKETNYQCDLCTSNTRASTDDLV